MVFFFLHHIISCNLGVSRSISVAAYGLYFFLFMAEDYTIVYIYNIYLIHSSVNGHCVCFHVLAIVNCAEMNIFGPLNFFKNIFLDICPRVGWLGNMFVLWFLDLPRSCCP